jgi:hypothetical protein
MPTTPSSCEEEAEFDGPGLDLAVWVGPRPASDAEAATTFHALYERYVASTSPQPPRPEIESFVETLLARWPDGTTLPEECVDLSPWASAPLMNDASGPLFYTEISTNRAGKEAWQFAIEIARERGLVALDASFGELAG